VIENEERSFFTFAVLDNLNAGLVFTQAAIAIGTYLPGSAGQSCKALTAAGDICFLGCKCVTHVRDFCQNGISGKSKIKIVKVILFLH
jgi:hypothetical protein